MSFFQDPPRLGNQYDDDAVLREYLHRVLPPDVLTAIEDELRDLGELSGGELAELQRRDRESQPRLTQWDPWGNRIDHIEVTEVWKVAQRLSAERGLVATAYERAHGEHSRVHQFVLNYLCQAALDTYSCPLAMTDGAARTLLDMGNRELIDRAVPRLTSRDPETFWTSGQWMTERAGGSDVGLSETVARKTDDGWRLYGTKWFTSATTSEMALTLGRPEGNGPGGKGLALFYVETRGPDGKWNGIRVNRLKEKFGTQKLPTAELDLDGTLAIPVKGLADGVRNITPMLNVTRTWNAVASAWGMRRGIALARDYATRRVQFGAPLAKKPLHMDTLEGIEAELEGAFYLAFRAAELLGRIEAGVATEEEARFHRVVTPLAKLTTGKQAVAVASEVLECFGGAGYVEDTMLPRLLADSQVLPIWEGTTNVLSLDTLRALSKDGTFEALQAEATRLFASASDPSLKPCVEAGRKAFEHATHWAGRAMAERDRLEAGARRFALTVGRALELGYVVQHAQWSLDSGRGDRAARVARRLARHGVDLIFDD